MGRKENEFQITDEDGFRRTYNIVPFITPDDIALLGMKAVAAEIKFGIEYVTPATKEARDHLVINRVTNRS